MASSSDYEVLELIGRGSFGQIRKVRRKGDGLILVRKEISYHRMTQKEKEQLTAEFGILAQLKHPNIVQYYHRDHIKADSTIHLYMEYCGSGDLSNVIRKCRTEGTQVPENFVWSIFTQIVLALYRCHNGVDPPEVNEGWAAPPERKLPNKKVVRILHRDLKPENVFLGEDNDVKLGDFGLSKMLAPEQHLTNTYVGTPYYMSPEIVSDLSYTHKSDIWSLGCIIYELCQLAPPFNAKTQWALIDKIKSGHYPPLSNHYSPALKKTIEMCLKVDHRQRPDTAGLLSMEPFILARRQISVVHLNRALKARDEAIRLREQQVLKLEDELRQKWEERNIQIYNEIDADLRQKWEVKAEMEIRKRVEMELQARIPPLLQTELERVIQEMDLVPRGMANSSSSTSTGSSSGFSYTGSPFHADFSTRNTVPDSPVDITMRSPSVMGTPGTRKCILDEDPPQMPLEIPAQMLPDELLAPNEDTRPQPFAEQLPESLNHTIRGIKDPFVNNDSGFHEPSITKRSFARKTGSPLRTGPRRRNGMKRAATTGMLFGNGAQQNHSALELGTAGDSLNVAGARKGTKSMQGMSLVDISRHNLRNNAGESMLEMTTSKNILPVPRWDPMSPEAPSPFKKNMIRR